MALTTTPSPCTDNGVHSLGDTVEVLTDGRRRKPCTSGCGETFTVEPDTTRIHADLVDADRAHLVPELAR